MKRRIFSAIALLVFCFSLGSPVLGAVPSSEQVDTIEPSDLANMSIEELQDFIHQVALQVQYVNAADPSQFENMSSEELNQLIHLIALQEDGSDKVSTPYSSITLAWIAAAEIVSKSGYPCAGTVVKASAYGDNYIEENGLIANTIAASDTFAAWKQNRKDSIYFEKSDNPDLFYAIHAAEIHVSGSSSGGHAQLYDVFDFKFETDMEDLFSTLVNDWAWLCQHIGALTPIDVWVKVKL